MKNMVILDLQQVMFANVHVHFGMTSEVDENMLRHLILNQIRAIRKKFKKDYPEFVIAIDSKNNWRRKIFPYYKANRKKARDDSSVDFDAIFSAFDKIKTELKDHFKYRVVGVDGAEADDVIGVLAMKFGTESLIKSQTTPEIMIVSGDKDFQQLQRFSNVSQYDPIKKREIKCGDPQAFLREHVLKGDSTDGIPNVLSDDDTLVNDAKRQPPMTTKRLSRLLSNVEISEEEKKRVERNEKLIDLTRTPEDVKTAILETFNNEENKKTVGSLYNYMIDKRLKQLTSVIDEF